MHSSVRVGLIGAGVFGGYHAGKIAGGENIVFTGIFDQDASRAKVLAEAHATISIESQEALFEASDAVLVASPAKFHFEICKAALQAGCHVLVEKPLATTREQARELVDLAKAKRLVLQVGHQERLVCHALGLPDIKAPILSLEILRAGPPPQNGRAMDVSVIWDLMIHDIDLAHVLLGGQAKETTCKGKAQLGPKLDHAEATFKLGDAAVSLTASRISEARERHMKLTYETGTIALDFLARTVTNTTPYQISDNLTDMVPDPLGAADKLFFDACRGQENAIMTIEEAAEAVGTAQRLEELAVTGRGE